MIMQNGSLKRIGRPPSWILKVKFFNGRVSQEQCVLETHVLHHRAKLRGSVELLQRYSDFSRFFK